jgi:glycosyltransferase domain-containing protein
MDHSLIIRTRNRTTWLENLLLHYKRTGYSGLILIGDDSTDDKFASNNLVVKNFNQYLDIQHVKGNGRLAESRVRRVFLTTHQMYALVTTSYFSVTSDDDFLFPEFVKSGIKFLEATHNSEYVCVHGPEVLVSYDEKLKIRSRKLHHWKGSYENDPLERIANYAENHSIAYYGISRTTIIKNSAIGYGGFLRSSELSLSFFDEEIPWIALIYLSGKIHYSANDLMGIRGIHMSDDRIDNFWKDRDNKPFYLGPIWEFSNPEISLALKESHAQIVKLIINQKSKYTVDIIEDIVWQMLWHKMLDFRPRLDKKLLQSDLRVATGAVNKRKNAFKPLRKLLFKIRLIYAKGFRNSLYDCFTLNRKSVKMYIKFDKMDSK